MGKIINLPSHLTAGNFGGNVVLGDVTIITDSQIEVSNISVSTIKSELGVANNNVNALCTSSAINPYSYFSPTTLNWSNGQYITSYKSPKKLGNFAAYNHNAFAPTNFSIPPTSSEPYKQYVSGNNYQFTVTAAVYRGERLPAWQNSINSWSNIVVEFEIDGVFKYALVQADSQSQSQNNLASVSFPSTNGNAETKTMYVRAYYTYLVDHTTTWGKQMGTELKDEYNRPYYGILVEGGGYTQTLNLRAAESINFTWSVTYSQTQKKINVTLNPSSYNYTFGTWTPVYPSGGSVVSQTSPVGGYTTSCTVNLDYSNDGVFRIPITATQPNYAPVSKEVKVTISDNVLMLSSI